MRLARSHERRLVRSSFDMRIVESVRLSKCPVEAKPHFLHSAAPPRATSGLFDFSESVPIQGRAKGYFGVSMVTQAAGEVSLAREWAMGEHIQWPR